MHFFTTIATVFKRTEGQFLKKNFSDATIEPKSLLFLRCRILYSLLIVSLLAGLLAYIPAVYLALTQKLWILLAVDTATWAILLIVLFAPGLSLNLRSGVAVLFLYILGLFIIIEVGPLSGGPTWLFSAAVIAGVLLGPGAALAAIVINAATLFIMGWLALSGIVSIDFPFFRSPTALVTAGANFIFLNTIVAVSVSVLIKSLEKEVTEKERAQKYLEESRKRYHTLFESASDAIFVLQEDLKILDCNLKAARMLESDKNDIIGSTPDMFSPGFQKDGQASVEIICQHFEKLRRKGSVLFEWSHIRKDGRVYDVEVSLTLIDLSSDPHIIAIVRDITQRRRLHDMMLQNEKMVSIGGLAAGMAHEINNPLAGIIQNIEVALNRINAHHPSNQAAARELGLSMEQISAYFEKRGIDRFLASARTAGDKAAKLVSNMLSFSYQGESSLEAADIRELMDLTIELAQSDYDLKKNYDFRTILIQREFEPDLPRIWCEKTKIQQVFFNLLKNGAQAMAEKAPPLDPSYKMTFILGIKKTGSHISIEIKDNGPGIDDATARHIFEPFFTTKKAGVGTGLGLWVSYFIIEKHKGTIQVDSAPGKGCCFKILLPIDRKQ